MKTERSLESKIERPKKVFIRCSNHNNYTKLEEYLEMCDRIRTEAKDEHWAFDLEEPIRSKLLYTLGQNSYGYRHQNLLIYESSNLLSSVPVSLSRGDVKTIFGKYCEVKTSYTSKIGNYSFLQIRLWQDLDGHIFKVIDKLDNYSTKYFCFTRSQIEEERIIQKPKATHGDKKVVEENKHVELSFRYNPNNIYEKNRWEDLYLQEDVFSWLRKL
jgi:hypothetical protein